MGLGGRLGWVNERQGMTSNSQCPFSGLGETQEVISVQFSYSLLVIVPCVVHLKVQCTIKCALIHCALALSQTLKSISSTKKLISPAYSTSAAQC